MTISNLSKQLIFMAVFLYIVFSWTQIWIKLNFSHAHVGNHWKCSKCNCILFVELCFNVWNLIIHNFCIVFCSPRRQSSSLSSLLWGRWPTCRCPVFRQAACSGFTTWQQQILFICCLSPSLEPCSSSWRSATYYPTCQNVIVTEEYHHPGLSPGWWSLVMNGWMCTFHCNHHKSSLLVGCRVRYRQPQPARHEDGVQDHAFHHPPPHHQLPHGQSVDHLHHFFFLVGYPQLKHLKHTAEFALKVSKIILFSIKPQAVFTYWLTSNCFSLAQVALLRHPVIRTKLNIPERIKHPASVMPQNDGFIESMKKGSCLGL